MRDVATREQEDDLEHTGQTYFSHSQRQPAHRNGADAQARGTSRASSPWIHLLQRAAGGYHLRPRSGLGFVFTVVCFWRTGRFAYISLVAGMSFASGRELLPFSYLSHLLHSSYGWRYRDFNSVRPYRPSNYTE